MAVLQRKRLLRRTLRHHALLAVASAATIWILFITRPYQDAWSRASFATAYPALALLVLTLWLGPIHVMRSRRHPVSSDLRRDVGIWAGLVGVAHAVVGQNVHLRGRPWLYYVYEHPGQHLLPLRHDLFGFANETGVVGTLLLFALLATSNDYAIRRLGAVRWKSLQRWNYAVFALASAHAIGYLIIERQKLGYDVLVGIGVVTTVVLQGAGFVQRRRVASALTIARPAVSGYLPAHDR